MSDILNWLLDSPKWSIKHRNVITTSECVKKTVNLEEILQKSEDFPIKSPIESIRNKTLIKTVPKSILERNARSVYPIIHEAAFYLCAEFLLVKQKHGSKIEMELYKNMPVLDFIARLLSKRAVVFVDNSDFYMLRDGTTGEDNNWENIGTENQKAPLILDNYLSYDELKLSAFLSVSSYSYFINDGSRCNNGIPAENRDNIEPEGIIIGLIGTRLPKADVMEHQDIILSPKKKNIDCNIQNLFSNFYQETMFSYEHVKTGHIINEDRFKDLLCDEIFDNAVYAKRLAISFDTLLLEANHRAQEKGKFAYVHVVGIGLGVWNISDDHQEHYFLSTFGHRIRALGSNLLSISDIDFSYFSSTYCLAFLDGTRNLFFPIEGHQNGGIQAHISYREPFTKLQNDDKLLVVSYAWDSNAHPGNEFWLGAINHSSDSATAASSQVSELHNPGINPTVCASNLMLATPRGIVPAQDYLKKVLEQIEDENHMDASENV